MGGMPLRGRVAAALLVGAGALALVLSTVPAPAAASSTTITVLAGSATVTNAAGSLAAASGDLVRPGDQVRTSSDGHAVLTFIDGSTMVVEPGASLVLEEASFRQGSVAVRVFQSVGLTWSSVSRLLAPESRFEVRTPAITASVRGTAFEVEVAADGVTRVRTAEGTVAVSNDEGEVIVGEGAETTAEPNEAPAPPSTPPPSTSRVLEIGERAVLIVDALGRGCGRYDGKIVQQIPGCVVREGTIEIPDTERLGEYRLAVTEDVGRDTSVVERTTAPGQGAVETVRVIELPVAELGAPPIQVATSAGTAFDVTLPLIGKIPVQVDLTTAQPAVPVARDAATAAPAVAARLTLPPLPFPAPTPTATAPTVAEPPVVTPAALPTLATAAPLATLAPITPVPTLALLTPAPTPTPTPEPTPTPTPILTIPPLLATASPTPTPSPTPEPTPTPTPEPTPTPPAAPSSVSATAALNVVTVTWLASATLGASYEIERSTGGSAYQSIGSTSAGTLIFTDTPGSGTHTYRIFAVVSGVRSQPASSGSVTLP